MALVVEKPLIWNLMLMLLSPTMLAKVEDLSI
jgi:hypothetical protein